MIKYKSAHGLFIRTTGQTHNDIYYSVQVPDLMKHYDWSTVYCERHISIFFIHMETLYIAVRGFKM